MIFNPEKYLASPRERLIYTFGLSLQYIVVVITLWTLFLGGVSYGLQLLEVGDFLERAPLVILVLIIFYYVLYYLTTIYFDSDTKIYKRVGVGFVKVTSAKHTEIDDMKVKQGFLEKIL